MCTLTFVPKSAGLLVGMNRDDLFARSNTCSPGLRPAGEQVALYPSEPTGGTWIGVNDVGLVFALLNWNRPATEKLRSRGEIIPTLLRAAALEEADRLLRCESLAGVLPFRLIGISVHDREISEWSWDGKLERLSSPWRFRQWFSSGLSDQDAETKRGAVSHAATSDHGAYSLEWLRRLHRSHSPESGPFSICAHRGDAGTLSYIEIVVADGRLTMTYSAGSPCTSPTAVSSNLFLRLPSSPV